MFVSGFLHLPLLEEIVALEGIFLNKNHALNADNEGEQYKLK